MPFQITALPASTFAHLFGLSDPELARHGAVRSTADRKPGFPCRVSLEDAEPGETVMLINHEHLPAPSPYHASHAVFVRENATQARPAPNEVPALFRSRLLSVRAYDQADMMLDAEVVEGAELDPVLTAMLANPDVAYLHLHNAKPGCYAARVDRA